MKVNSIVRVIIALLLVPLGGIIYLTYRTKDLLMFQWVEAIHLSNTINQMRLLGKEVNIPSWIKYSFPDGLWLLSYLLIIDVVWHNSPDRKRTFWLSILPFIAISSEIMQIFIPQIGTFDYIDLSCYMGAITIFQIIKVKSL